MGTVSSRFEDIIQSIIDNVPYTESVHSREEELLLELKAAIEAGGGGGGGGGGLSIVTYGTTTFDQCVAAYESNALVYCRASSGYKRMAFLAYVERNVDNSIRSFEFQYYRSRTTHNTSAQTDEVYIYKLDKYDGWTQSVRTTNAQLTVKDGSGLSLTNGTGDSIQIGNDAKVTANPGFNDDSDYLTDLQIGDSNFIIKENSDAWWANYDIGENVKDYGAVGDGATDDSQAFIDAMSAAATAGTYIVVIPRGDYNLNHVAMNLSAAFTFVGQDKELTCIINSNISAPYGITCDSLKFLGGTVRNYFDAGYSSTLRAYTVAILATPQSADAEVIYRNCRFSSVGLGSVAYHNPTDTTHLASCIIENCEFDLIERIAVYHSLNIDHAEVRNCTFKNIGSNDTSTGALAALVLGDTSNSTLCKLADGIVEGCTFDTLKSAYDTQSAQHTISANFLQSCCDHLVIRNNVFKNMDGIGYDREGVYIKGNYVEIANNAFYQAGSGEAYICCKRMEGTPPDPNADDRIMHIHHNFILGEYGEGIRIYGPGVVHDNFFYIKTATRAAIRFFPSETKNNDRVDVYNNYISCGVGELVVRGETITSYYASDAVIMIHHSAERGMKINHNYIRIITEQGFLHGFQAAFKAQYVFNDVEVKDNFIYMQLATNSAIVVSNNSASVPSSDSNFLVDIENNYSKAQQMGILSQFHTSNTHLKATFVVKNNFFEEMGTNQYAMTISGPENNGWKMFYESLQPSDAFSPKRHVYAGPNIFQYIYTTLSNAYFMGTGINLVSTDFATYKDFGKTATWGQITGTIANQTDLMTAIADSALDSELPAITPIESVLRNDELAYKPDTTQYILLYVDDARNSLSDTWEYIHSNYGNDVPLNVAVPTNRLNAMKDLLHEMEDAGCEILSHSTDTDILLQSTTRAQAYARLRDSKAALLREGFKVNGFCQPGGAGAKTFTEMGYDDLVRMFYLYSDTGVYPTGINKGRTSLYTSGVTIDSLLKSIKRGQNARKFFFHEIGVDVTEEYLDEFIATALNQGFIFTTEYEYYRTHAYSILDDRLKKLEKSIDTYKRFDAYLFQQGLGVPSYDKSVYPYAFIYENGNRWFIASDSVLIKDSTATYVTYKKSDGSSFNYKKFTFASGVWGLDAATSATSLNTNQNQNAKRANYDIYDSNGSLICGDNDYYNY